MNQKRPHGAVSNSGVRVDSSVLSFLPEYIRQGGPGVLSHAPPAAFVGGFPPIDAYTVAETMKSKYAMRFRKFKDEVLRTQVQRAYEMITRPGGGSAKSSGEESKKDKPKFISNGNHEASPAQANI